MRLVDALNIAAANSSPHRQNGDRQMSSTTIAGRRSLSPEIPDASGRPEFHSSRSPSASDMISHPSSSNTTLPSLHNVQHRRTRTSSSNGRSREPISPTRKRRQNDFNRSIFGDVRAIPVGSVWETRLQCAKTGVHAITKGGIHGSKYHGAYSVVLNGSYEDDVDEGETFIYTGQGGRIKPSGDVNIWQTCGKVPQTCDQDPLDPQNQSLEMSAQTKRPVRVVRGPNTEPPFAPAAGFRYDGLYTVETAEYVPGKQGYLVWSCRFRRNPGQPPLPRR